MSVQTYMHCIIFHYFQQEHVTSATKVKRDIFLSKLC